MRGVAIVIAKYLDASGLTEQSVGHQGHVSDGHELRGDEQDCDEERPCSPVS
ncbi:MAG: hypothetical protein AB7O52_13550 [Planctomycetota bacterium]